MMATALVTTTTAAATSHRRKLSVQCIGDTPLAKKPKLRDDRRPQQPSAIEQLPLELLEDIFLESKNAWLPNVSRRMRHQLSSNHVRKKFVTSVLRSEGLLDVGQDLDFDFEACGQISRGSKAEPYADAMKNVHTLLAQSWLTFKLLRQAIKDWQWEIAASEVHDFLIKHRPSTAEAEWPEAQGRLRTCLEKSTSSMTTADMELFGSLRPLFNEIEPWRTPGMGAPWLFRWPPEDKPSPNKIVMSLAFIEDPWSGSTALGCMKFGICKVGRRDHRAIKIVDRKFIEWSSSSDLIPSRLMAGPWTQDRGDLFKFLIDQIHEEYLEDTNYFTPAQTRALDVGLTRAIVDNNTVALCVLINDCVGVHERDKYEHKHVFCSDRTLGMEAPKGPDPWYYITGDQLLNRRLAVSLVKISAAQLHESIDRFHDHPATSLKVFEYVAKSGASCRELDAARRDKLARIGLEIDGVADKWSPALRKAAQNLLHKFETGWPGAEVGNKTYHCAPRRE